MRHSHTLSLLAVVLAPFHLQAQAISGDLSVGATDRARRVSVGIAWSHPVGSRIRFGLGPRLTLYGGDAASYRRVGGGNTFPDHLVLTPAIAAVALAVSGDVRLTGSLALGANLDLLGLTAGPSRQQDGVDLAPGRGAIFLYGNRDRGSLTSEFFARWRLTPRWAVRGGLSHYVTGYQQRHGEGRYLRFETVPFAAVQWRP